MLGIVPPCCMAASGLKALLLLFELVVEVVPPHGLAGDGAGAGPDVVAVLLTAPDDPPAADPLLPALLMTRKSVAWLTTP